jgi:rubrerythrin
MKVLRYAEKMDQSARRFYEEMANRADNPGVGRVFHMLAEDEEELLRRHQALAERRKGLETAALDGSQNVFEELRLQEDRLSVPDDVAAYRLAIEAERQVLRQYRRAADAEARPEVKRALSEIAEEEQHHLEELENLHDFANAPNQYLAWGEFSNLGDYHNFGREIT